MAASRLTLPPAGLSRRLQRTEAGRAWLANLPRVLDECCELWRLDVGEPFEYAHASLALPVTLDDGSEAVLKLQFPHRESEHEADALRLWDGDGAVRLLAHDPDRSALLLERLHPGTALHELGQDAALDVVVGLLPRLWRPAGRPFRPLADEAAWWVESLPTEWHDAGRPFERSLLDAALEALETLPASQREQVLVNQDLHADNVIAGERAPWLVIDPKPLIGEREFGIASVVRGGELGHSRRDVLYRLDRLTSELRLDRDRTRLWAMAHTIAWSADSPDLTAHHDIARWLLEA